MKLAIGNRAKAGAARRLQSAPVVASTRTRKVLDGMAEHLDRHPGQVDEAAQIVDKVEDSGRFDAVRSGLRLSRNDPKKMPWIGMKEDVKQEIKEHGMNKHATEHGHLTVTHLTMVSDTCQ